MLRAPLFTLHEAAAKLKVKESTIRQWIKDRELRAIKFGREWRIAQIDLETFLNQHANMPSQGNPPPPVAERAVNPAVDRDPKTAAAIGS